MGFLSSPIPRANQPKYSEGSALRSNRDSSSNAQLWKKNSKSTENGNASAQGLQRVQRQINRLERRMPGRIDQFNFFPFCIYNCPIPHGAPADTAAWQCWQVRSGIAAGRSQYFVDTGNNGDYYFYGEARDFIITGADGNEFQSASVTANAAYTNDIVLIPDSAIVGATTALHTVTFVLPKTLDTLNQINAAFWIRINDFSVITGGFPKGISFQIQAQRYTQDVSTPISHFPYPIEPDVIPIGRVAMALPPNASPYSFRTYQELFSHAVNRFPVGVNGESPAYYRGNWTDNNLDGKLFWQGDQFQYDDGGSNIWLLAYRGTIPSTISGDPTTNPDVEKVMYTTTLGP